MYTYRRPLAGILATALMLSLVVSTPTGAYATPLPGGAPNPPEPVAVPAQPIVGAVGSVGYLPGSWDVTPSGAFDYTIPIDVPAGRAGVQPALALRYGSGSDDATVGMGWSLSGASSQITRCGGDLATDGKVTGVRFDHTDHFCLDGRELVELGAVPGGPPPTNAEFRTEDDGFAKITGSAAAATAALGFDRFEVRTKDGRIRTYLPHGAVRTTSGVTFTPQPVTGDEQTDAPRAVWLLDQESDRSGNAMTWQWSAHSDQGGTEFVPSKIVYTSHTTPGETADGARWAQLDYEARPDASSTYAGGVHYISTKRIKTISLYAPNPAASTLAWRYTLGYTTSASGRSLLATVTKCGIGAGCLRPKKFGYQQAPAVPTFTAADLGALPGFTTGKTRPPLAETVDLNGDGADDLLWTPGGADDASDPIHARLASVDPATGAFAALAVDSTVTGGVGWPAGVDLAASRMFDLDGDGASAIAANVPAPTGRAVKLLRWDSGHFVDAAITIGDSAATVLTDMDGDGRADYITDDGRLGGIAYYSVRRNNGAGFDAPTTSLFPSGPVGQPACGIPRATDVDGDGRGDLVGSAYINGACSTSPYVLHLDADGKPVHHRAVTSAGNTVYDHALPQLTGYRTILGDFNGDGLEDDLLLPTVTDPKTGAWDRPAALLWNTGAGLAVDSHVPGVPHDEHGDVRAADVNGDGRSDLVAFTATATTVLLSSGDGTFTGGNIAADGGTSDPATGRATSMVGDFNGDGRTDVARVVDGHELLLTQDAGNRELLWTVTDAGTGWAAQTATYSTRWSDQVTHDSCAYPVRCIRHAMTVVRQVAARDGLVDPAAGATPYVLQYSYADPAMDLTGRGFLGFGVLRVWDPQRPAETTYDFGQHKQRVDGGYYPGVERPVSVTTAVPIVTAALRKPGPVPTRVTRTLSTYAVKHLNNGRSFTVVPKTDTVLQWEQPATVGSGHIDGITQPAQPLGRTDRSYGYDDFGNRVDQTDAVTGGTTTATHVDFDNRVGDWLISLPTRTTVTSTLLGASLTRTTDQAYDALGRLTTRWLQKGDPAAQTTSWTLNDWGTTDMITVSAAGRPDRVQHLVYTPVFPGQPDELIYPSQVWSDHSTPAYRPSTWTAVQPAYGVTVATEDANGVQSQAVYDDLGRPVKVTADGQDPAWLTYANRPDAAGGANGTVATAQVGAAPQLPRLITSTTDARNRQIAAAETAFDGQQAITTTRYDQFGRVASTTAPAPGGTTSFVYDNLDRILTTTLPGAVNATSTWTFTTQTATAPGGLKTDTAYDHDGRISSTAVHNGSTVIHTGYQYGPFGLLAVSVDDQGHQTAYTYDVRGRQIQVDDPDTGRTTDTYLGTGELAAQTHMATGETTAFAYDDLGREVSRTDKDGVARFTWDTAPHGIGRMAATHSADGIGTSYAYDADGHQTRLSYSDDASGAVYTVDQTYTPAGRLATTAFPEVAGRNRFTLTHGYNNFGFASGVSAGGTALATVVSRMPDRSLRSMTLGSSTEVLTYDQPTGRLHAVTVAAPGGTTQDLAYGYQADGRLSSRTDAATGRTESYGYDQLGELTSWTLGNQSTGYAYDTIGNLTAVTGGTPQTFGYGTASGGQPHTLTSVVTAASDPADVHWDGQGRQTSGSGRTVAYTARNLPRSVTVAGVTTTLRYDAFGKRVVESTPGGSAFFVPGRYEHRVSANVGIDVFYVDGPDGTVAQVVYAGSTTTTEYLLRDAQGSVVATADPAGVVTHRFFYEPFGARTDAAGTRISAVAGDVDRGYTGDRSDDGLGLIDMNGRVYDPVQHAFLSADPRNRPAADPYAYVRSSPLNFTDPTGFVECDAECEWFNDATGSSFGEFTQAGEAYQEGGAHGLASEQAGRLSREYGDYLNHVKADVRAELERQKAAMPKSDGDGYRPADKAGAAPAAGPEPKISGKTRSVTIPSATQPGAQTWDPNAATDDAIAQTTAVFDVPSEDEMGDFACEADPASCTLGMESASEPAGASVGDPPNGYGGTGHGIQIQELAVRSAVELPQGFQPVERAMPFYEPVWGGRVLIETMTFH